MKRLLAGVSALALAIAPLQASAQEPAPPLAPVAEPTLISVSAESAQPTSDTEQEVIAPIVAPAPSRLRPDVTTDEGGLWGLADRTESAARGSAELNNDPVLNAYLRDVACRVAAQYCGDIRLYVMERPYFNASMAPNGYMEVWSGLLLRAEDEAQLAFVLGHEIGHYGERHSLETMRTARSRSSAALFLVAFGVVGSLVYLGTIATLFGFSRENELEADMIGFNAARAAGYDRNAGVTLWGNLNAEAKASDDEDVRRRDARASIFDTHPLSADRVGELSELAAAHTASGETRRERYRAAIRPFLDPWLRAELRRRDFGELNVVLDRLAAHGEDLGVIEFYRGEVYRLRRGEGDLARAQEHYQLAIAQLDAPARTWREYAELLSRAGETAGAAANYLTYLERAPNAEDRVLVEARLSSMTQGAQ